MKNKKGFTLVELLATIVILGIISTVTIVTVTEYYQRSKEKTEDAFKKQVEGYVYDYITLSGSKLAYVNSGYTNLQKCYKDVEDEICEKDIDEGRISCVFSGSCSRCFNWCFMA